MRSSESVLSMHGARRRSLALCAVGVVALAAHLLMFSGIDWAWPERAPVARQSATNSVSVRMVEAPHPIVDLRDVLEPRRHAAVAPAIRAVVPPTAVKTVAARMDTAIKPQAQIPPAVEEGSLVAAAAPAASASAAAAAAATNASAPNADAIPRYRTQVPPAITLRYVMQRGGLRGTGEFAWKPAGDRYELRLEGSVAGLGVLTQVSSGGFDGAGIAPLRFTDQRLRRGTKATNFQRAAGKITFSGPSAEFPLREGTQDRLSWMVQLGAIVAAEPALRNVGAKVVMNVVGSNADLSVWAFDCMAIEQVETPLGTVNALKFVREPREPYDTQVQVWIDPARHYLPVRAAQKSGSGDEAFELRLQSVDNNP